ncbi:TetR/AcrR family transcriptional regulator [Streptomyces sp. NBC_01142]|uniref:TetR/AcrR family transcriptional regulator n=1 Tax=Streptomyces sp. NBC_01142 TaxID=2975865 RepID=UPI002257598B|nr:TetR/AcrR family transcriptional regulator [Streptomyces sp. NBC_01142]MCX4825099.1 TetR/AcrR family transcriptional regulator [Streptomyces sp. NBC_01142]
MSTVRGARERARIEVTAAIKDEARKQLAAEGAAKLSLRAVARELGMVSSALYRYFPSRDDLLTALIVDAYDSVGTAAETALAKADAGARLAEADAVAETETETEAETAAGPGATARPARHLARWIALCSAVRTWALAHPHEYALIYGSPVPGYTAPQDTIGPASRVGLALISVARDAHRADGIALPPLADGLRPEARRLAADLAPDLPPAVVVALVAAWSQLFGLISFELFGQFNRVVEERDAFFAHSAARLAHEVGLRGDPGGVLHRE